MVWYRGLGGTINIFKNRLDKYWSNQEVFFMILMLTWPELEIYQFVSECVFEMQA